jgi:hypothetical protein
MLEFTPHFSPSFTNPQFLEKFHQVLVLNIYTCVYIICTLFIILSLPCHLPPPTGSNPPPLHRTFSALLFSCFVKEKKIKRKT